MEVVHAQFQGFDFHTCCGILHFFNLSPIIHPTLAVMFSTITGIECYYPDFSVLGTNLSLVDAKKSHSDFCGIVGRSSSELEDAFPPFIRVVVCYVSLSSPINPNSHSFPGAMVVSACLYSLRCFL